MWCERFVAMLLSVRKENQPQVVQSVGKRIWVYIRTVSDACEASDRPVRTQSWWMTHKNAMDPLIHIRS